MLQGLEPECVYEPMFLCKASMNAQPFSSPNICSQALTSKKPVPEDAGLGITILPAYSGLVRSCHEVGMGRFCLLASMVLTHTAAA
ncbi:Uncharacterised protein [Bordetella pertussis]|nr:Uncharacterised protein [Bordetella pertussis]CFP11821.1 Uncharacterised protein [Bordetella pertussis]CPI72853.1 Uncharacterised protein [Bordetella pertussis]